MSLSGAKVTERSLYSDVSDIWHRLERWTPPLQIENQLSTFGIKVDFKVIDSPTLSAIKDVDAVLKEVPLNQAARPSPRR